MHKSVSADKRWMPVEEVWAEDGQGQPLPQSVLSLHNGSRMPRQEAGIALLLFFTPRWFQNYLMVQIKFIDIERNHACMKNN
jgi:hypothetical protein